MNFYTPWIVTFVFGAIIFVAGLRFQHQERKRRAAKRAAEEQQRQLHVSWDMADMIAGNRQRQGSRSAPGASATASASGAEAEIQGRVRGLN